jgi:hypothetical protein
MITNPKSMILLGPNDEGLKTAVTILNNDNNN